MSDAAFKAVFITCRQVRDEVHFTFSVPVEMGAEYLRRIGEFAKPGESRWCAIARINIDKEEDKPQELHKTSSRQTSLESEPARPHNPYSRRAGILSNDPAFQTWIKVDGVGRVAAAADYIRHKCGVTSRKDILPGTDAALRFDLLQSAFVVWRDGPRHGVA